MSEPIALTDEEREHLAACRWGEPGKTATEALATPEMDADTGPTPRSAPRGQNEPERGSSAANDTGVSRRNPWLGSLLRRRGA